MFRLIKLAFYALVGYAIYEMYQGMMEQQQRGGGGGSRMGGGGGGMQGAFGGGSATGSQGNMTGPGQGMDVPVADASGAEMTHTVGRGVIS